MCGLDLPGSGYGTVVGSCEYGNVLSGSMKEGGGTASPSKSLSASQGLLSIGLSPFNMNMKNNMPKCQE
jgi:hypothetical protein